MGLDGFVFDLQRFDSVQTQYVQVMGNDGKTATIAETILLGLNSGYPKSSVVFNDTGDGGGANTYLTIQKNEDGKYVLTNDTTNKLSLIDLSGVSDKTFVAAAGATPAYKVSVDANVSNVKLPDGKTTFEITGTKISGAASFNLTALGENPAVVTTGDTDDTTIGIVSGTFTVGGITFTTKGETNIYITLSGINSGVASGIKVESLYSGETLTMDAKTDGVAVTFGATTYNDVKGAVTFNGNTSTS